MGAVSTFHIPKNKELRKKWLDAIPRKNWIPSQSASVCQLHFKKEDMNPAELDYQRHRLKIDSVPSVFDSFPTATCHQIYRRKKDNDLVQDFSHLINMYPRKIVIPLNWNVKLINNILHFFTMDILEGDVNIRSQVSIFDDLQICVLINGIKINISELKCFVLSPELKLNQWSQLQFLLKMLSEFEIRKVIYFEDTKIILEV